MQKLSAEENFLSNKWENNNIEKFRKLQAWVFDFVGEARVLEVRLYSLPIQNNMGLKFLGNREKTYKWFICPVGMTRTIKVDWW